MSRYNQNKKELNVNLEIERNYFHIKFNLNSVGFTKRLRRTYRSLRYAYYYIYLLNLYYRYKVRPGIARDVWTKDTGLLRQKIAL